MTLNESTLKNVVRYIRMKYKDDILRPRGSKPKGIKMRVRAWGGNGDRYWEPHPEEAASCCANKQNTKSNPYVMFRHCSSNNHILTLIKEKPEALSFKLQKIGLPIEVFDLEVAPTLINHPDYTTRRVVLETLKGSYT